MTRGVMHIFPKQCPNCFRFTWNGKKCSTCGAVST